MKNEQSFFILHFFVRAPFSITSATAYGHPGRAQLAGGAGQVAGTGAT
jgi:hypothetical protein